MQKRGGSVKIGASKVQAIDVQSVLAPNFLEKAIMFERSRSIQVMVFHTVRCCPAVYKGLSAL
jgi:hypothetical protein